ncbi:MAG: cupin domain-containing protein [Ornithinimicrobium sp.]
MTGTDPYGATRVADSALARLIATDRDTFADQSWAQGAVLSTYADRGGMDDFSDLFGPEAVDELLSRRALRTPFIRLAQDGTTLPESRYTIGGGVGAGVTDQVSDDAVLGLFGGGATIVLQALHRTWAPIAAWSARLAAELGHPVQVNAYITPAQSQGFADHYDVHDVFVMQVHGRKEWSIREPVIDAPLRDQPWAERKTEVEQAATGSPTIQHVLNPGDCLYLPRGYIHSAKALGGISIHLTVGVHGWTRHHLAGALLDHARRSLSGQRAVRQSLKLGVDVTDPDDLADDIEVARAALLEAIAGSDAAQIAHLMTAHARSAQRPEPVSPIATIAALDDEGVPTVRLREHLVLKHSTPDSSGRVHVRSRAGRFTLEPGHRGAFDILLRGRPVSIENLDDDPDVAAEAARLFVHHGVAVLGSRESE